MKKAEIILVILSLIGAGLSLLLIPGGAVLTLVASSSLILIYMWMGLAIFNDIPLGQILSPESYKGIHVLRIVGSIITGIVLSLTILGILFRFMMWQGSYLMLLEGLVMLGVILIVSVVRYAATRSDFYYGVFIRVITVGLLGLLLMLTTKTRLVEIKYRNYPTYIEAYKKSAADPNNAELREKAEEERQKMHK